MSSRLRGLGFDGLPDQRYDPVKGSKNGRHRSGSGGEASSNESVMSLGSRSSGSESVGGFDSTMPHPAASVTSRLSDTPPQLPKRFGSDPIGNQLPRSSTAAPPSLTPRARPTLDRKGPLSGAERSKTVAPMKLPRQSGSEICSMDRIQLVKHLKDRGADYKTCPTDVELRQALTNSYLEIAPETEPRIRTISSPASLRQHSFASYLDDRPPPVPSRKGGVAKPKRRTASTGHEDADFDTDFNFDAPPHRPRPRPKKSSSRPLSTPLPMSAMMSSGYGHGAQVAQSPRMARASYPMASVKPGRAGSSDTMLAELDDMPRLKLSLQLKALGVKFSDSAEAPELRRVLKTAILLEESTNGDTSDHCSPVDRVAQAAVSAKNVGAQAAAASGRRRSSIKALEKFEQTVAAPFDEDEDELPERLRRSASHENLLDTPRRSSMKAAHPAESPGSGRRLMAGSNHQSPQSPGGAGRVLDVNTMSRTDVMSQLRFRAIACSDDASSHELANKLRIALMIEQADTSDCAGVAKPAWRSPSRDSGRSSRAGSSDGLLEKAPVAHAWEDWEEDSDDDGRGGDDAGYYAPKDLVPDGPPDGYATPDRLEHKRRYQTASSPGSSHSQPGRDSRGNIQVNLVHQPGRKIGLRLEEVVGEGVYVEEVVPGTLAEDAGWIQPGDMLLRIDDTDTSGMSKDKCMALITLALQRGANRSNSPSKGPGVNLTLSGLAHASLSGGSNMSRRLSSVSSGSSGSKIKRRSSTFSNASASDLE